MVFFLGRSVKSGNIYRERSNWKFVGAFIERSSMLGGFKAR